MHSRSPEPYCLLASVAPVVHMMKQGGHVRQWEVMMGMGYLVQSTGNPPFVDLEQEGAYIGLVRVFEVHCFSGVQIPD